MIGGGLKHISGLIAGIILMVVGMYVVVALIPGVNTTVATITTPTYQVGVTGLTGLYTILIAVAGIMMAVNSMKW